MAVTKVTPDGLSAPQLSKNLFHNGDFAVQQRGDITGLGASVAHTFDGVVALHSGSPTGRFSVLKSTTVPANTGHRQSMKVDITTADSSIAAGALYYIYIRLEAQDVSHLRYGESDAKSLTISFWTRSTITGDYTLMVEVPDGSRAYSVTYNIASADTWEKKTITIAGDTGGTINNDTGVGITLRFTLTAGSNYHGGREHAWASGANNMYGGGSSLNLFSSTSNDWYIAGLQVEEGSVATDFNFQDFGTTLRKCLRYYERITPALVSGEALVNGYAVATTYSRHMMRWMVEKRATPTVGFTAAGTFSTHYPATATTCTGIAATHSTLWGVWITATISGGPLTAGLGAALGRDSSDTTYIDGSADL